MEHQAAKNSAPWEMGNKWDENYVAQLTVLRKCLEHKEEESKQSSEVSLSWREGTWCLWSQRSQGSWGRVPKKQELHKKKALEICIWALQVLSWAQVSAYLRGKPRERVMPREEKEKCTDQSQIWKWAYFQQLEWKPNILEVICQSTKDCFGSVEGKINLGLKTVLVPPNKA